MEAIIVAFYSYISGSIPFGLILTKIFTGKDVRKIGSGNIGATNVLRSGNKILAAITLFLDMFKGYIPVFITFYFFSDQVYISCIFAFLGHIFAIWLNFKGGKGVATYLGVITALSYELFFLFIFTWVTVVLIFKYSSVASIFSSITIFVVTGIRELYQETILLNITDNFTNLLFFFLVLIIFTHRNNIINLKNNIEPKIKL